ncbi:MAG: 4-hydroxybenzoate octaprenyltransferase [Telmatospirillum sp.]|nr:4-hydroxybenzoate octaprenyltransferase [Telmatospirillum sp.]
MKSTGTLLGDIPVDGWIDRLSPVSVRPYLRLMRLDRPTGTWLLMLPGWWSIALGADRWPDLRLMLLFGIGALVMRGAGCTFNDIVDRDFDGRVARTAARPIPSGAVSPFQATLFLGLQLFVGLTILLQFNATSVVLGVASLALVFTYPFMKRITYWPQAWLGLTFNWGALLGWAATGAAAHPAPMLLYVGGFFWTLGYDTIYAHQDKEDDALIGVRSTALRLGAATPSWLVGFYALTIALLLLGGWTAGLSWAFYPLMLPAAAHLVWQIRTLDIDNSLGCLERFKSNRVFGLLVLMAILGGKLL